MTTKTIKVRVTLEVDVQEWADEYGLTASPSAVRADFIAWLETHECFRTLTK